MKRLLAWLLLTSSAVTLAEDKISRFHFPPFALEEIRIPRNYLTDNISHEDAQAMTVEELRGIMATGDFSVQAMAAKELLVREDQMTILRLIYSLKQGNVLAIEALSASTLAVIPYLMEEVAQGSLDYYGSYSFGDGGTRDGWVRQAAVKLVVSILFRAPEFTGETGECLKAIGRGDTGRVQGLSDVARNLVQWWLLNEKAFVAGKWDETLPLPQQIIYGDPLTDTVLRRDWGWDPGKQPPFGSPAWELPEPFEVWAERIVDPKRRNLDFVALSWDGAKVIEHPAKSFGPRAKPKARESRKTLAQRNPQELDNGNTGVKDSPWMFIVASMTVLVLAVIRWMKRKPASRV
jgi:hypothetical protein